MAKPTGFIDYHRQEPAHRPVAERVRDFFEVELPLPAERLIEQAARCMDCGIPFCHGVGCPLANGIPDLNDLVYRGRWRQASDMLHATNNFPEITGRVCPAMCEAACSLAINDQPVTIRHIEYQIAERAWAEGWIVPRPPARRTGRRVAIVGSGPAGLAAAQQLARAGHDVVVFEKDDRIGGLLRYGIPDYKLDKRIIDRRLDQLRAEGVDFQPGVHVGKDVSVRYVHQRFDAICLAVGAGWPRDLKVPGRELANVHFALDFLTQQNRLNAGDTIPEDRIISARDKRVVVIGGGDTGSDCVGTAIRQGAKQVQQFEILPKPPEIRPAGTPWPMWPTILRTSTAHEEGCDRRWSVLTRGLAGADSRVSELHAVHVEWLPPGAGSNGPRMKEIPGSEFVAPAELVLVAMGFMHAVHAGLIEEIGLALDERGNVRVGDADPPGTGVGRAPPYMTSQPGIFAAGDAVLGASLVARAIRSGRDAANAINRALRER